MSAIADRLRSIKDRVLPSRSSDNSAAKLERARKKAAAEAQRREHQRRSNVHRK